MPERQKIEYEHLETGYEFHPASYRLDIGMIATYLRAVGDTSPLHHDSEIIPPMAVATLAMTSLLESISLPGGTIHVSQEIEFIDPISIKDTITCHARVIRKHERGKLHLMAIELNVFNQTQKAVLSGKTSFVLPKNN